MVEDEADAEEEADEEFELACCRCCCCIILKGEVSVIVVVLGTDEVDVLVDDCCSLLCVSFADELADEEVDVVEFCEPFEFVVLLFELLGELPVAGGARVNSLGELPL